MPRVLAFIAALFVLSVPLGAQAAPDCRKWRTDEFWKEAGTADVERCLSAGADIKARWGSMSRDTPLHYAAGYGTAATVNALLDRGADPNAQEGVIRFYRTPLHYAAKRGNAATVNALLDRGADIEGGGAGLSWPNSTPLHVAAWYGNVAVVYALLDRGADIEVRTREGEETPLHWAAEGGKVAMVNALLDRGADITARNVNGKTPFDLIRRGSALKGTDAYFRLKVCLHSVVTGLFPTGLLKLLCH